MAMLGETDATVSSIHDGDYFKSSGDWGSPSEPCSLCNYTEGTWFRWLKSGSGVRILCGSHRCDYETPWFEDRQQAIEYWNVTSKLSR